jgi:hypothetical protein
MALEFEYCECGCKGHEATAGSLDFWLFNDLKGKYTLNKGHGWMGARIGVYKSHEQAVGVATEMAMKEMVKIMEKLSK